jgi:hypothetical protein
MTDDLDRLRARVLGLKTPSECEQLAKNVESRGKPEIALLARKRAIELRALSYGAATQAEREALEAVYAYERTLFLKHNKIVHASRTWKMIKERGIIPAVERVVTRAAESTGYTQLVQMGMQDKAFEAVVLRHPHLFSDEAVRRARERLEDGRQP